MGELHLEIIVDRLRREFKVECTGAPQVNYRGNSRPSDVRYVHKKQSGGSGQFADVAIKFEPGEPGSGFEFDLKSRVVLSQRVHTRYSQGAGRKHVIWFIGWIPCC